MRRMDVRDHRVMEVNETVEVRDFKDLSMDCWLVGFLTMLAGCCIHGTMKCLTKFSFCYIAK